MICKNNFCYNGHSNTPLIQCVFEYGFHENKYFITYQNYRIEINVIHSFTHSFKFIACKSCILMHDMHVMHECMHACHACMHTFIYSWMFSPFNKFFTLFLEPQPVDGQLTEWSLWSNCTVGSNPCFSTRSRQRTCANPAPAFGGKDCRDIKSMEQVCASVCPGK